MGLPITAGCDTDWEGEESCVGRGYEIEGQGRQREGGVEERLMVRRERLIRL
jgi:hypothetical protein